MANMPTWGEISQRASTWANRQGEWCGVPMPIEGLSLSIEESNPWRDRVLGLQAEFHKGQAEHWYQRGKGGAPIGSTVVNSWRSERHGCEVFVIREPDGRHRAYLGEHDNTRRSRALLDSMWVANVWSLDAELTAMERLADLLGPGRAHLYEAYIMTGMFLEASRRSGITYLFRRLRPTLAIRDERILCGLCLHPIGYYEGTWAGSMVPTDDVIAHLLLMRGDEHMFWKRANHHGVLSPLLGL